MKIMAFDLSSACTGVTFADINNENIIFLKTFSIRPEVSKTSVAKKLGYIHSENVATTGIRSWVKSGGEIVSKTEKKKRDVEVRNAINAEIKKYISTELQKSIDNLNPDLILVERNESFNGVLTTKFLAEIRGILEGVATKQPIIQYSVAEIRKKFDLAKMTQEYVSKLTPSQVKKEKDITKNVIKEYLEHKYQIHCANTDESDSLAVFDHYYEKEVINHEG
ncbi:MAG: hypothetical protein ACI4RS_05440 [Monoglobaceae bacterium]